MAADLITQLLDDIRSLDPERFEWVQSLRETILRLQTDITEEVKYGGILFSAQKPFCGIFCYAKHVSLEFGAGASLADPFEVLEGKGKLRRHIKLFSEQDIAGKHVGGYLVLALKESMQ